MKKLLSYVLIFSFLFNICSPAFAAKKDESSDILKTDLNSGLKALIRDSKNKSGLYEGRLFVDFLVEEMEEAYRDGDKQKALAIEDQIRELTKLGHINYYYTTRADGTPALVDRQNALDQNQRVIRPTIDIAAFEQKAKDKSLTFGSLIEYINPKDEGAKTYTTPEVIAAAADLMSQEVAAITESEDKEIQIAFAHNTLYVHDNPSTPENTSLDYIQRRILGALWKLKEEENHPLENDVIMDSLVRLQAIGSLRVALLRILNFYEATGQMNYYFAEENSNLPDNYNDPSQKAKSQQELKDAIYTNFKEEMKKYGAVGEYGFWKRIFAGGPSSEEAQGAVAKLSVTASYASLYAFLDNRDVMELFKLIPLKDDEQDKGSGAHHWENQDNSHEHYLTTVYTAMISTGISYYFSKHQNPLPFLQKLIARPDEPGYSGYFFPLPARISALDEAFHIAPLLADSSDDEKDEQKVSQSQWDAFAPFAVYQAASFYCPLDTAKKSGVFGLNATEMNVMANLFALKIYGERVGRYPDTFIDKFTKFLKNSGLGNQPSDVLCNVKLGSGSGEIPDANRNLNAEDYETAMQQLNIVKEAAIWIIGGKIFTGAWQLLTKLGRLPFAIANGVRAAYKIWKTGKSVRSGGIALEFANEATINAARTVVREYESAIAAAETLTARSSSLASRTEGALAKAENYVSKLANGGKTGQEVEKMGAAAKKLKEAQQTYQKAMQEAQDFRKIAEANPSRLKELQEATTKAEKAAAKVEEAINEVNQVERYGAKIADATFEEIVTTGASATEKAAAGASAAEKAIPGATKAAEEASSVAEEMALATRNPSRLAEATQEFVGAFKDSMTGPYVIKKFLRKHVTEVIFRVKKGDQILNVSVRNNRMFRRLQRLEKAGKIQIQQAFLRQRTLGTANWFSLSRVPRNYKDLASIWRAAAQDGRKTMELVGKANILEAEKGFRLYNYTQAQAVHEIARLQDGLALKLAKGGGVDMYAEVTVIGKDGVATKAFWNMASKEPLPENVIVESLGEESTIFFLPASAKGAKMLTEAELTSQQALKTTLGQFEKEVQNSAVDKIVMGLGQRPASSKVSVVLNKILGRTGANNFSIRTYVQSSAAANLAVAPTKVAAISGRNIFTRALGIASTPFPQAKVVSKAFLKASAPSWVPNGTKTFYHYAARLAGSEFAKNVYAFEVLYAFDGISLLRTWQTYLLKYYSENDLEEALKDYPRLKAAIEENKAKESDPENQRILSQVQEIGSRSPQKMQGLFVSLPFFLTWRGLSNTRKLVGTSAMEWLDFNFVSETQRAQLAMQNNALIMKPIAEQYAKDFSLNLVERNLDKQYEELIQNPATKALIGQTPGLKEELKKPFDECLKNAQKIFDNKNLSTDEQKKQFEKIQKELSQAVENKLLEAEEATYTRLDQVKNNKAVLKAVKDAFTKFRNRVTTIRQGTSNVEQQNKQIEQARKELYEDLKKAVPTATAASPLETPGIKEIVEAEKKATGSSQLEKEITQAMKAYEKTEQALRKQYAKPEEAQALNRELVKAQKALGEKITTSIQDATYRAFKRREDIQMFITLDKDFEAKFDKLFNDHNAAVQKVQADASLSQTQKDNKIKTLSVQFNRQLLKLGLDTSKKLDLQRTDVEMMVAAYPELLTELEAAYEQYKKDILALDESSIGDKEKTEKIHALQQDFVLKKQEISMKYVANSGQDPEFWSKIRANATEAQWTKWAKDLTVSHMSELLVAVPQLADRSDLLQLAQDTLSEYMQIQISLYQYKGTNLNIAMVGLITKIQTFKGKIEFACGPQEEMAPYQLKTLPELETEEDEYSNEEDDEEKNPDNGAVGL